MFTDVSLSSDLNANFKDYIKSQPGTKLKGRKRGGGGMCSFIICLYIVNFDILVLTAGAWPLNQKDDQKTAQTQKFQIPTEVNGRISHLKQKVTHPPFFFLHDS